MHKKKIVYIIGGGQIGSRHLQALKTIEIPLEISVVDPSHKSLETAKERYDSMPEGQVKHSISYLKKIPNGVDLVDLAIVATSSNVRAIVTKELLKKTKVRHLILEKLLFQKRNDFAVMEVLFEQLKVKVWVNCSMRVMPFYRNLKKDFNKEKISYRVTGNESSLVTDIIHYIDHIAYLTGSNDFVLDTRLLDKKPGVSKRKGFLELTGTLLAYFKNGSIGIFSNPPQGLSPKLVEIFNHKKRCIVKESESKCWISKADNWQWEEVDAPIPYQSQLTTDIVEEIFSKGACALPKYNESKKLHLLLLEPLRKFLNKNSKKKFNYYPFT